MPTCIDAAVNNALWCDLICRLHGAPGSFAGWSWRNTGPVPALYPNYVSTSPATAAVQMAEIAELVASSGDCELSVKDSFQSLDLGPLGFEPWFDAEWYHRPVPTVSARAHTARHGWCQLHAERDLEQWEIAWRAAGFHDDLVPNPLFPSLLLKQPGVAVLACVERGNIVAGAIAFHADGTVGLTNFFSAPDIADEQYCACVDFIANLFPSSGIVGYEEPGFAERHAAKQIAMIGQLRIWWKPGNAKFAAVPQTSALPRQVKKAQLPQ
jgi:hypothetical protein